jgi:hypothetical protein
MTSSLAKRIQELENDSNSDKQDEGGDASSEEVEIVATKKRKTREISGAENFTEVFRLIDKINEIKTRLNIIVGKMEAEVKSIDTKRADGLVTVFMVTMTGKKVPIHCALGDTVEILKGRIRDREGIPEDQQRLIFNGKQLEGDKTVGDYAIRSGSVLHLVLRLRGC